MSLADTIKKTLVPIHPEGYKFIAIFAVVTVLLGLLWDPLFWIGLILTAWCAYFFRDPERHTPLDPDLVISPADGRVSAVAKLVPPPELELGPEDRGKPERALSRTPAAAPPAAGAAAAAPEEA